MEQLAAEELIPIDLQTNEERLGLLLSVGHECTRLDYKELVDLSSGNKKGRAEFAKDIVSMANHYPGGYIVIGATDDGKPSPIANENKWEHFDTAVLNQLLARYIETSIEIVSQRLTYGGNPYCVICVKSPDSSYLIPFFKEGSYSISEKEQGSAFRVGEISRRVNAKNEIVRFAEWPDILAHHDEIVRQKERETIDDLMRRVTSALSEHGKLPPLEIGMPLEALDTAMRECFEQNAITPLHRYISQLKSDLDANKDAVYGLASVACYAAMYRDASLFNEVLDMLYDYFRHYASPNVDMQRMPGIAIALYAMGSAAVRAKLWEVISPMVNRPGPYRKQYASWLRFAQVMTSHSERHISGDNGLLISATLDKIKNDPLLRPDSPIDCVWEDVEESYLISLCSFDYLYCACVYVEGEGGGGAYPCCAAYFPRRTSNVMIDMFTNASGMRDKLFTKPFTKECFESLRVLFGDIKRESFSLNGWYVDPIVSNAFDELVAEFSE